MRVPFLLVTLLVTGHGAASFAQDAKSSAPTPAWRDCYQSMPMRPELGSLNEKIRLAEDGKATLEMQALTARANAVEKKAISQWMTLRGACFEQATTWMDTVKAPLWYRNIFIQTKDSDDALASALYRGDLTFGQFNVKHTALDAEFRKLMADAIELARRESAATRPNATVITPVTPPVAVAALPPPVDPQVQLKSDRYQCETEATRTFPILLIQRMTNPGYQAPQRAQQTNCTRVGAQIDCRSQPTGADASIWNRPPSYVQEDANRSSRAGAFGACMEAKGYGRN